MQTQSLHFLRIFESNLLSFQFNHFEKKKYDGGRHIIHTKPA